VLNQLCIHTDNDLFVPFKSTYTWRFPGDIYCGVTYREDANGVLQSDWYWKKTYPYQKTLTFEEALEYFSDRLKEKFLFHLDLFA
jgi:hypothetical protein